MRMRRIRNNKLLRKMTEETTLSVSDFIYPLFVVEGENIKREIPSMPGVYHFSEIGWRMRSRSSLPFTSPPSFYSASSITRTTWAAVLTTKTASCRKPAVR